MSKRILSIILAVCLAAVMFSFPVLAAADVTYTVEKDKITLAGQTDTTAADQNVSVVVLKNGVTYQQYQNATPEQTGALTFFAKTGKTTAGGAFSMEIKLPENSAPMSMIAILGDAAFTKVKVMTVIYATQEDIAAIVTAFNAANTKDKVIDFLDEYETLLGTVITKDKQNNAFYNYLASKTASSSDQNGLNQIITFYNDGMLKECIEQAKTVEEINTAVEAYDVKSLFVNDDLELVAERELDSKLSSLLSGKTYSEAEDAVYRLNESIFLTLFNNTASRDEMISLFNQYNETYVGVNTGSGSNYSKADKQSLFKTIAAQAAKTPFQDGDSLKKAIDKAATPSGGGGNTGNGGSTGGGGNNVDVYPTPTPAPVGFEFNDIGGVAWAKDSIYLLVDKGVIAKDPSKQFRPDDSITRQEYVKLLVTALDIYDANASCDFADVPKDEWYYPYIASAVSKGIVKGVSDTEFGIDWNITREDIAALTFRAAQAFGMDLPQSSPEKQFADAQDISAYAQEAIAGMTKAGIINGYEDNTFRPKNTATRAEAAVIIGKFIKR